jgi:hypothetical protein
MGKEYSSSFKRSIPGLRFLVARVLPRTLYKTKLAPGFNKKIKETKKFLKNNPDYNLLVAQNHLTPDDALFGGYVASRLGSKRSRYAFGPTSAFHSEIVEGKKKNKENIMNDIVRRCGVETIPVVQNYQLDDFEKYGFTQMDAIKKNRYFMKRVKELGESEKKLTGIIMPEGHRSEDGSLGKAEKGIEYVVKQTRPLLIVTLGVSSPEELERDHTNFGKRIDLGLGEIIDCGVNDKLDVDTFMRNLATALPPRMRGKYGE